MIFQITFEYFASSLTFSMFKILNKNRLKLDQFFFFINIFLNCKLIIKVINFLEEQKTKEKVLRLIDKHD